MSELFGTTDAWTLGVIVGLAVVTVVARGFFVMSSKTWQLPHGIQRGLQYAPIAALSAVVVPEIVMSQGEFISTWLDARLFAAAAGVAESQRLAVARLPGDRHRETGRQRDGCGGDADRPGRGPDRPR